MLRVLYKIEPIKKQRKYKYIIVNLGLKFENIGSETFLFKIKKYI